MKKMNSTLIILILIMLVNALSYGTIIPLLYPYSSRFGIGPFGLSLLFASFSLAQFISTPILGRLSDKFGRKPVLLFCLLGTSLSLGLFAAAHSVLVLFIARIIDGITGGNISVAQAVIADTTEGEERAKGFGLLGASFGFGFLFGPALGGLMSEISITAPFWFAAALGLVATAAGMIFLKETLDPTKRQDERKPLFPVKTLVTSLFHPLTGIIFLIGFIVAISQNGWIIGFQSYTNDVLKLSPKQIGLSFALFGIINIVMQSVGIKLLIEWCKSKKNILTGSMILSSIALFFLIFTNSFMSFLIVGLLYATFLAPYGPMITSLLSERTKAEDQGGMLGLYQAYNSLGQIIGPLAAGFVTRFDIKYVFVLAFFLTLSATGATRWLYLPVKEKFDL